MEPSSLENNLPPPTVQPSSSSENQTPTMVEPSFLEKNNQSPNQTMDMDPSSTPVENQSQISVKDPAKNKKKKKKRTKIEALVEEQQPQILQVEKKIKRKQSSEQPPQPKSSLFERVFTHDDEITLLKEWASLRDRGIQSYSDLYSLVKDKITQPVDSDQVKNKLQKMRKKYFEAELKRRNTGKDPLFPDSKLQDIYKLSRHIWIKDVPSTNDDKLHTYIDSLKGMGLYDLVREEGLQSLTTQQLVFQLTSFANQLQDARDLTIKMIGSLDH